LSSDPDLQLTVLGSLLTIPPLANGDDCRAAGGITCAGTDAIVRSHPTARWIRGALQLCHLGSAGLTVVLATVLLPQAPTRLYQLVGFVVTGLLLILVISAEYYTVDPPTATTSPRG